MRVTGVDMYSASLEEAITFSLQNSDQMAQYEVRTIIGLDAEEIITKFYGQSIDGKTKFYDLSLKPRDIIMRIVLKPRFRLDESYSDIRDRLYRNISANRSGLVTLHFKSGGTIVAGISGAVVKFEAVHFTKVPEVQLTIRCNDPMFKAINPVLFEAEELQTTNPISIPDGLSTSPHGFMMELECTADVDSFTVQDTETDPEWKFKIIPVGGFLIGDVLHFSSEYANKHLYLVRGETTIQLADVIEPGSIWPIVFPGSNHFHFTDISSFDWNFVKFYASYWGV